MAMTWQSLFQQALSLHHSGRLVEAERLYKQALKADRRCFPAQYNLATLLHQQQRQSAALRAVESALKINPNAQEALTLRTELLLNAGQYKKALASISKVVAREPGDAGAWYNRGAVLTELLRFDEALDSYEKALAIQPTAEAWNNHGLVLYRLKRFAGSLKSYDRAIEIRPDYNPAWFNRGEVLQYFERFDEALVSYDKAIAIAPDNFKVWEARAIALRYMRRIDDALTSVDKALAIKFDSSPLLLRGWLLCEFNRITEGLAILRQAAGLNLKSNNGNRPSFLAHKRRHDAEQRDYLAELGVQLVEGESYFVEGDKLSGPVINSANAESAATQWKKNRPQIAVIDNLLTSEALEALRRFCWGSTMWQRSYDHGYIGAMPEQGFSSPLLAQIAEELRDSYPTIIEDHPLRMLWGYKCDSRLKGLGIHADQAAVNVNFWITPDDANLDKESGGLIVWDVEAPEDWKLEEYNGDEAAVRAFLDQSGAKATIVPYRANRAVIFDSNLFHESDAIHFKDGYLNRRINLTMLYGRRTYCGS
jgi:tetratricopeptide (TPR) repeat protein